MRFSLLVFFITLQLFVLGQTSGIKGSITDNNGEPLFGATVYIVEAKVGSLTNAQGIFTISKLPEGELTLRITYVGYDSLIQKIKLEPGKTITLSLKMEEYSTETIEIIDEKINKIEKTKVTSGVTKISSKEINLIPTLGSPDLAQYLQVVPGVVVTGDQGGQLYIRGGTPIQNATYMDGALIYNPFHSIGLFSVFDTDIIRNVDVYSGGFSGEYGGRVSSVMDIQTRNGNFNRVAGKINVNPFTSSAILEGPMFKSKGNTVNSWLVSARTSYLDKTSKSLYSYVNDTIGLPYNFLDIYAKTTIGSGANTASFFGFHQRDNVNYGFPSDFGWRTSGGGTQFRILPANSLMSISGNFAISNYKNEMQAETESFVRRSSIGGFNGSINFNYIFNTVDEFVYGIQLLGFKTDFKFTNSFGLITQQQDNNTEAAGYFKYKKVFRKKTDLGNGEVSYFSKFILEPSLRIHYYNDHTYVSPEPRLRLKYNLKKVAISLAAGRYSQNLVAATSDKDIVALFQGYLSAPENPANQKLKNSLQVANHLMGGVEVEAADNLYITLEGWYKKFNQLTNINRDKLFPSDPNFIAETGKAFGADFIVKYQTKKLYLYGTYGWAKVERDNGTIKYYTIFDRRHTANVVASFKTGEFNNIKVAGNSVQHVRYKESKWEFSLRWTIGSGFPFTQTQAFFEKLDFTGNGAQSNTTNQNGNLGILLSDDYNGGRLPYFHRLDVSMKRRWSIKDKVLIEANATLINTYNRKNLFYFDRIRNSRVDQLPILPSAGISVSF